MAHERIIREKELVTNLVRVSRSTLWRWEKAGAFPKRRKLSSRTRGWLESEILEWMASRERVSAT